MLRITVPCDTKRISLRTLTTLKEVGKDMQKILENFRIIGRITCINKKFACLSKNFI